MERLDHIYIWKHLYWRAIQDGYEPQQAEEFANRMLSTELKPEQVAQGATQGSETKAAD